MFSIRLFHTVLYSISTLWGRFVRTDGSLHRAMGTEAVLQIKKLSWLQDMFLPETKFITFPQFLLLHFHLCIQQVTLCSSTTLTFSYRTFFFLSLWSHALAKAASLKCSTFLWHGRLGSHDHKVPSMCWGNLHCWQDELTQSSFKSFTLKAKFT